MCMLYLEPVASRPRGSGDSPTTSATQHPDSGEPGVCCAQEPEPRLPGLLKMLLWAQTQLDERVEYPRCSDLVTATLSDPGSTAAA